MSLPANLVIEKFSYSRIKKLLACYQVHYKGIYIILKNNIFLSFLKVFLTEKNLKDGVKPPRKKDMLQNASFFHEFLLHIF